MKPVTLSIVLIVIGIVTSFAYRLVHPERVLYRQAESYFEAGDCAAALPIYRELAKSGLQLPRLYERLADSATRCGSAEEAVAAFELLRSRGVVSARQLATLAGLYARQGRFPQAVTAAREAVAADPGEREHRVLLGRMLTATGSFEEAAAEYQKALGGKQ